VKLVPLTPLMKGADEDVVHAGVRALREQGAGKEMEVALALFASFVMSAERVRQIVRWEMAVLRESPWYQEIVQEGVQKGQQKGFQEGRKEGLREGLREGTQKGMLDAILHLVQTRFDLSDSDIEGLVTQLQRVKKAEVLRQLLVNAASVESMDDFGASLEVAVPAMTSASSASA
jgi:predicted transposase YdaD